MLNVVRAVPLNSSFNPLVLYVVRVVKDGQ